MYLLSFVFILLFVKAHAFTEKICERSGEIQELNNIGKYTERSDRRQELVIKAIKPQVVILVLGSHDDELLQDRMNTAIKFAKTLGGKVKINWFLSGGTKRQMEESSSSEAESMRELLYNSGNSNWKIKIDTLSKNTAENFAHFRKYVESETKSTIYVVTSNFHHARANSILSGIIPIPVNWILSPKACPSCHRDEKIHIFNVKSDIKNALLVYNKL